MGAMLIATHNEGGDIMTPLAQYTKNGDKDDLIAAIVQHMKQK